MPRPPHRPNKVGEHQVLKRGGKVQGQPPAEDDDDDSRTERMPALQEALETSEQLWEQGTQGS